MFNQTSLELAAEIICYFSAAMCLLSVSFLLIKVNKRIPGSFALNISLYSLAILSRAISLNNKWLPPEAKSAITSSCVCLIELSLAYFIYQINALKIKIREDIPDELSKKIKNNQRCLISVLVILAITSFVKIFVEYLTKVKSKYH